MKHFTSITKKSLSLILAVLLLTACAAVPAWALVDIESPVIGTVTDNSIVARVVDVPAGTEYQFCAIPAAVEVTSEILIDAAWSGETANECSTATLKTDYSGAVITASTSYKVFSRAYDVVANSYYKSVEAFTSTVTLVAAPQAPAVGVVVADAQSATYVSVTFTVTNPLSSLEYSANNGATWNDVVLIDSSFTVTGLTHSEDYIFYFRYKSAEGQADAAYPKGTLAVAASTKVKEPWTPAPAAPILSGYRSDSEIGIVFVSDDYDYYVNGVFKTFEKRFDLASKPTIIITGLAAGTNYFITCVKRADEDHRDSAQSAATIAATKIIPGIPTGQSTSLITDTVVSMTYSANVEYACVPFGDAAPETGWVQGTISMDNVVVPATFRSLTPGTKYSIYYKYVETANQIEGEVCPNPLSVTTKFASAAAPINSVAPVIIDKSMNTIKVAEVSGVEFCIGLLNGNNTQYSNWQTSGTFNGLLPNANYSIKARYICDTAVQMPGKENIQTAYTTSRVGYAASIGNCSISTTAEVIRANSAFTVAVKGDKPASTLGVLVYGDTRIVPVAYYTNQSTTRVAINGTKANEATFSVTPSATGNLVVTVIFASQKYKGLDANGDAVWDNLGEINDYANYTVKAPKSNWTDFQDIMVKIINVFTNVIPKIILALSGMFGKK